MKYDTFFSKAKKPIYIRCVINYSWTSGDSVKRSKDGVITVYSTGLCPVEFFYCTYFDSVALKNEFPELIEENYHRPPKHFVKTSTKWLRSKTVFDFNATGAPVPVFKQFAKKAAENRMYIIFRHQNSLYI